MNKLNIILILIQLTIFFPNFTGAQETLTLNNIPSKLQSTDGKWIEFKQNKEAPLLAFIAMGTKCPIVRKYIPIINKLLLRPEFQSKKVVIYYLALDSHDSLASLIEEKNKFKILSPILLDLDQTMTKALGLKTSSEVSLVDLHNKKIQYVGAVDDGINFDMTKKPKHFYFLDALTALLSGKTPVITHTPAFGCAITFNK